MRRGMRWRGWYDMVCLRSHLTLWVKHRRHKRQWSWRWRSWWRSRHHHLRRIHGDRHRLRVGTRKRVPLDESRIVHWRWWGWLGSLRGLRRNLWAWWPHLCERSWCGGSRGLSRHHRPCGNEDGGARRGRSVCWRRRSGQPIVSKHHSPLVWPRRDDDAAAVPEVELEVVPRLLDPLLPRPDDGVPVDPHDGYGDDDDAEDDAELGWRVQAVPFVVCAPRTAIASCLMLGEHTD